jgi:hypothetical protein
VPGHSGDPVLVAITADVPAGSEEDFVQGFRDLASGPAPPGMKRTELLRLREGGWRIQTLWESLDALLALRQSGTPPAALQLLDRIGAEHSHEVLFVEQSFEF